MKTKFLMIICFFMATMACKKNAQNDLKNNNLKSEAAQTNYFEGEEDEEDAEMLEQLLSEFLPSLGNDDYLEIHLDEAGAYVFNIINNPIEPSEKEYCRGELSISFAKCVAKALKNLDCIQIRKNGDGTWSATDCNS